MADNTTLPGTGEAVATDDIGGVKYQRVKLVSGQDGVNDGDIHIYNGLPIQPAEEAADAFGRLRTSEPRTIFDSQLEYDLQRVVWESNLGGSSTDTHVPGSSGTTLAVTAATETAIRQTRKYHRYQPGKSQLVKVTGTLKAAVAGVDKRMGYFDGENGVFLEQNSTTALNFVIRSKVSGSVVNSKVAQASWNIDAMDGAGVSGITLDVTKSQLIIIDLAWLSVGRVRVGFEIGTVIHYVHEFHNANTNTGPYMTTANLPVRYEIDNTTGASTASILCLCSTVISEGGADHDLSLEFAADSGAAQSIGTTENAILAIRPKATFNSITNRGEVIPFDVHVYSASQAGWARVWYGATLGGSPSFSSSNADSIVEFDVAATTVTGGILLHAEYVDKKGAFSIPSDIQMPMTIDLSGSHPTTPHTDVLVATFETTSGSSNCFASMTWKEIR